MHAAVEVHIDERHTKLNLTGVYSEDIRRIIIYPGEIVVVYAERDEKGHMFVRGGDIAERVEIHKW
jgi:hypothetical protein